MLPYLTRLYGFVQGLWVKTNIDRALNHFDDFYGTFYGTLWPSTRVAMLSAPKHCALVNYYADYEKTIQKLKVKLLLVFILLSL